MMHNWQTNRDLLLIIYWISFDRQITAVQLRVGTPALIRQLYKKPLHESQLAHIYLQRNIWTRDWAKITHKVSQRGQTYEFYQ